MAPASPNDEFEHQDAEAPKEWNPSIYNPDCGNVDFGPSVCNPERHELEACGVAQMPWGYTIWFPGEFNNISSILKDSHGGNLWMGM